MIEVLPAPSVAFQEALWRGIARVSVANALESSYVRRLPRAGLMVVLLIAVAYHEVTVQPEAVADGAGAILRLLVRQGVVVAPAVPWVLMGLLILWLVWRGVQAFEAINPRMQATEAEARALAQAQVSIPAAELVSQ